MRVSSILKNVKGVVKVDADASDHTALVSYDSEQTNLAAMVKTLAGGGFPNAFQIQK